MMPGRVFARVDTSRVPDESTICQFRHLQSGISGRRRFWFGFGIISRCMA